MFTVRRWWERRGLQVGLLSVAIASALALRYTNGSILMEIYQTIARPLETIQNASPQKEIRNDKDIRRINELKNRIAVLENQNKNLQKLINYKEKDNLQSKPIIARVVGRSADSWWQQVTLNRGSLQGIQKGFIVKAEGGLVGLIDSVTPNTSRVLLVSDSNSRVGVSVSRTGAGGVLTGNFSTEAELEFLEKVPNVKVGDLVSTSIYSKKFPSGLAIGKVKSLDLKRLPTSVAVIELSTSIRSLDWVQVYPKPAKAVKEEAEQKAN
ncbi:MAG: rod shape-determining protein MreC [Cyanobacteria bacterium P01_A01_bin.45]